MIFIPEPCDCVLCCLKCYICSSVPHTNLCSCHSCYTHQPCYQPNHTGSIWLRRKARIPGESAPQLAPTGFVARSFMLQDRLPSNDEGYIGLEQKKVDKDRAEKGKVDKAWVAALFVIQPKLQNVFLKPGFKSG